VIFTTKTLNAKLRVVDDIRQWEVHAEPDLSGCWRNADNDVADGSSPGVVFTPTITGKVSLLQIWRYGYYQGNDHHSFGVKS
jgi:hypothetical protein